MTVQTNAVIFYGYAWEDQPDNYEGGEEATAYVEGVSDDPPTTGWFAAREAWSVSAPVNTDTHCSDGYPIPYICISKSEITSFRGDAKPISAEMLSTEPEWDELLSEFCARFQITPPEGQSPQWWLVSWWG